MNKNSFQRISALFCPLLAVALASVAIVGCSDHEQSVLSTHEGHEYVDLGLPSGTKWATVNIGGENDSLASDYFSWGETETKTLYSTSNYKWAGGYESPDGMLQEKDDVAHVKWGGKWRLPTKEEFDELIDTVHNTTWTVSPVGGRLSCIVKSKHNGKSIRLTAWGYRKDDKFEQDSIGFYLGGTIGTKRPSTFYCLGFCRDTLRNDESGRYYGFAARPVFK